jgi:hypothetical protein
MLQCTTAGDDRLLIKSIGFSRLGRPGVPYWRPLGWFSHAGQPSTDVLECLQHASECELQPEGVSDPAAKQSFLDLATRWRRIAETMEYIGRVDRFLSQSKH